MNPDYIVIGAGSAGCVVANRLSGSRGGNVLLLEAGGSSRGLLYRMPLGATKLWFNPKSSWGFQTEPEPGIDGRRIPVSRGKALGGSSAINGTVYNRGCPADYDSWSNFGLQGWDYNALLPNFRRIENHWRGGDELHGGDGEVPVNPLAYRSPFTSRFLAAAREAGLATSDDHVGPQAEGIGLSDLNVNRHGRRMSAYDAFIHPIRQRSSLNVQSGVHVLRINIEHGKAVGVDYLQDGRKHTVRAQREVILAGGAIASPQLLMLSGVGNAAELEKLGINVEHDLPTVGRNLNDQPGGSFEFRINEPFSFNRELRADRFGLSLMKWLLGFNSIAAGPPIVAAGAVRTSADQPLPDLRLNLAAATMQSKVWYPGFTQSGEHRLMMSFAVSHPVSRGQISLASADPLAAPKIQFNLLTEQADIDKLSSHYRLLTELIRQPSFAPIAGDIVRPAKAPANDKELAAYLRSACATTSHPMGSCRMGMDSDAVVDDQCRVRGIENLRVVDASVFPTQISGNPHATVMMLGDKISENILENA